MFWHSLTTRRHSIESINARNLFSSSRPFSHIVDFLQLRSHQRRLERRACRRLWLQRRSISILFITLLPLSLLRYLQRTRAAGVEWINLPFSTLHSERESSKVVASSSPLTQFIGWSYLLELENYTQKWDAARAATSWMFFESLNLWLSVINAALILRHCVCLDCFS